jgi:hypothetical protein
MINHDLFIILAYRLHQFFKIIIFNFDPNLNKFLFLSMRKQLLFLLLPGLKIRLFKFL